MSSKIRKAVIPAAGPSQSFCSASHSEVIGDSYYSDTPHRATVGGRAVFERFILEVAYVF